MIKVDFHTHSEASRDGGISPYGYARALENEQLDMIAITDHDRIDFALGMQQALGADRIIVGEEISTLDGEIIGLFLTSKIKKGLSALATIDEIRAQNGIVYVPHAFETVRKGLQLALLDSLEQDIDIIEAPNGRAVFQNFGAQAYEWAQQHRKVTAAGSDAHGARGLGYTYTSVFNRLTRNNTLEELKKARIVYHKPPYDTLLYPKFNLVRNYLRGHTE